MTPLRQRMIEDMTLAGLAPRTQEAYIQSVRGLAGHYNRSPDKLSEEEVRRYLLAMRDQGAARGTFKTAHYGIQFMYRHTLGLDWALFSKKRFAHRNSSGYPRFYRMPRLDGFWPAFAILSTGLALA